MRKRLGRRNRSEKNEENRRSNPGSLLSIIFTTIAGVVINDLRKDNSIIKGIINNKLLKSDEKKSVKKEINNADFEIIENEEEK